MHFTSEQYAAISTHHRNLIVTAGAGSGKTRVLVERFLALLDSNPDWLLSEVVAITFTEKAAREMRERIRVSMAARFTPDAPQWSKHIAALDSARIGTIHSLCAAILRANPAEAQLDPDFTVLDEAEARLLRSEAVETTLAHLVERPAGELFTLYSVRGVRDVLMAFAPASKAEAFIESLPPSPDALLEAWSAAYQEDTAAILDTLRGDSLLIEACEWQPPGVWPSEDKLMAIWEEVHRALPDVFHGDAQAVTNALQRLAEGINLKGGSGKAWGGTEIVAEARANLKTIREAAESYLADWPRPLDDADHEAARRLFLWAEAVHLAAQTYRGLKAARAALDFDDLEHLTAQLLKQHPAVAARYAQTEFKHVMVDEFQDTNSTQREIVYRLCGIGAQDSMQGRLFVVGDPKQSIYAFRGADVSVFNAVQAEIVAAGGELLPLSRSFRTHARLVEGCNALFEHILGKASAPYEVSFGAGMSAERPAEAFHHTPIDILVLDKSDLSKEDKDGLDVRAWEAHEIARYLLRLREERTLFYHRDGYRPFEFGDAAILFRSLTHTPTFEAVFKQMGIPYITVAGRGYYDRQEVWDLMNLLRALHNHSDNLALAGVLRSPMFGLSDDGLFALRLMRDAQEERLSLWDALMSANDNVPAHDQNALNFARHTLTQLAALSGRVTVAELLTAALDATAYDALLTALPDGDRRRGNIEKLLMKAQASGRIALGDFRAYLDDLSVTETREGEATMDNRGAVQMMSVHASKGLEFPLVILASADWTRRNNTYPLLQHDPMLGGSCLIQDADGEKIRTLAYQRAERLQARRDAAEHKRLLYVAATRAQDKLVVSGVYGKSESWLKSWCETLGLDFDTPPTNDILPHTWGNVRVEVFRTPPAVLGSNPGRQASGWDVMTQYQAGEAVQPPLLASIPPEPLAATRHLSVAQLEHLGSIPAYHPEEDGLRQFRQSVLHDAPPPIAPVIRERSTRRIVGSMVHRALRVGALPDRYTADHLRRILESYAWDEGITGDDILLKVVEEAEGLLQKYAEEGEPDSLRFARRVLREVPFMLNTGTRILHGQLDVLYENNGQWYVLDYKTAPITRSMVGWHARRYHLQVGAYARAVQERTGAIPMVQLYYLHPGTLINIPQPEWESALADLDRWVSLAMEENP